MNPQLEALLESGVIFDFLGILGLGLVLLAAVRLACRERSWGGTMLSLGAAALLGGRLYFILAPHFVTDEWLGMIGPIGISLTLALPPLLVSFGLAGVVWGLWGHERWLRALGR